MVLSAGGQLVEILAEGGVSRTERAGGNDVTTAVMMMRSSRVIRSGSSGGICGENRW